MIANYLEQRWFRWLVSATGFIPLLVFEFYDMPWFSIAYLGAMGVAAAVLVLRGDL